MKLKPSPELTFSGVSNYAKGILFVPSIKFYLIIGVTSCGNGYSLLAVSSAWSFK